MVIPEWCSSRFCGFRSLCTTPLDCRVYIAKAKDEKMKIVKNTISDDDGKNKCKALSNE